MRNRIMDFISASNSFSKLKRRTTASRKWNKASKWLYLLSAVVLLFLFLSMAVALYRDVGWHSDYTYYAFKKMLFLGIYSLLAHLFLSKNPVAINGISVLVYGWNYFEEHEYMPGWANFWTLIPMVLCYLSFLYGVHFKASNLTKNKQIL